MLNLIALSIGLVVCMGILLGLLIGITAKIFEVKQDPRLEKIEDSLPGANCGGCGYPGCSEFAKALLKGQTNISDCPVCSEKEIKNISGILGIEAEGEKEKQVAVVLCGGDRGKSRFQAKYNGINDCKSAELIASGAKGCKYGCLGLGTCARICPFNAIEIKDEGIAVVDPNLCVGCGKCVNACPRSLIKMVPAKVKLHVFCSSPEKGSIKRKVCKVACIGCKKCVKNAEENQMLLNGSLVQVNYDNPPEPELVDKAKCPTGCLKKT